MKVNRNLAIAAVLLLVASIWTYHAGSTGDTRFERGRRLLPNLNPDDVAAITITRGDQSVTLNRDDDGFTVAQIHDYPATNQAVNRVLRTLVELELDKDVGTGDDLYRELGLTVDSDDLTEVVLAGADGSDMVQLRIGRAFEDGPGSYVRRVDTEGPAYLSSQRITLSPDPDTYLDKEIVRIDRDEIEQINGPDYSFARGDADLELEGIPRGRTEKASMVSRVKNALGALRFDEVFLADDEALAGLQLKPTLDVRLNDGSGYRIALAERNGDHFLQIAGYHTVDRVSVDRDESTEELAGKAEILARADEVSRFNSFHGSWIYKISSSTAETLGAVKADLIENAD